VQRVSRETVSNVKSPCIRGISVIGRGRWGSSLLAALEKRKVPVVDPDSLQAEIYWLCVPDAQIERVARRLTRRITGSCGSMGGRVLLHSSGVYSSAILSIAREAGAVVASVHPLMSFPTRKPVPLDGVPFAVEAAGRLKTKLYRLVKELGGRPFAIQPEGKALYHAAAVMASPLLVSLAAAIEETARLAGLSGREAEALLQPIMEATLRNYFRDGAAQSFSGPFARGDAKTVSLHLAALRAHPLLSHIYTSLALHAVASLPVENQAALKRVLRKPSNKRSSGTVV
jgi:predicted short-subunit dehydrogenase-like oxidoreductase (DUF2520 family)